MPAPEVEKKMKALLSSFEQKRKDGTYVFTDTELREFLPLLVLAVGHAQKGPLAPSLSTLMTEFSKKAGISGNSSPQEISKAVDEYYKKNPLKPAIAKEFQEFVKKEVGTKTYFGEESKAK